MPHFKCVACKTRMYGVAGAVGLVGDLCPGCGALLEPVGELAEIVGFQSIRAREGGVDDGSPDGHQRLAERVDEVFARQAASRAQARFDTARWIDDGGSFSIEAVAERAIPRIGRGAVHDDQGPILL